MTTTAISDRLRAALKARETMIADLCKKGLASRNSQGQVDNRDNHPLRVPLWRKVDSEYWNALHEASEAGVINAAQLHVFLGFLNRSTPRIALGRARH